MYQLVALRLRRPEATLGALTLLEDALAADPQPDRAEALLRDALARGAARGPSPAPWRTWRATPAAIAS